MIFRMSADFGYFSHLLLTDHEPDRAVPGCAHGTRPHASIQFLLPSLVRPRVTISVWFSSVVL